VIVTIIYWAFIVWAVIQCCYAFFFSLRILPATHLKHEHARQPVSVIICARNEADNLRQNLPHVLQQQYAQNGVPEFEVVVVDDASTDETPQVLKSFCNEYRHLSVVTIPQDIQRDLPGKKFALRAGVKAAKYDHLLLTDADCAPASRHWLSEMSAPLDAGRKIVAGYGAYSAGPGLLNKFVRWETMHSFLQSASYTRAGKPYMAVGRNVACSREMPERAQELEIWQKLPSGDDDLMVSRLATKTNIALVRRHGAFTVCKAPRSLSAWVAQKRRHLSTGKYYPAGIRMLLGLYGFTHAAVWFYFIALMFTPLRWAAIPVMAIRCLMYWFLWTVAIIKLREKKLAIWLPLMDVGWMLYNFTFLPYILFKNKQRWN